MSSYLLLPGTATHYMSTPDRASLHTGAAGIQVTVDVQMADWVPGIAQTFAARWRDDTPNRSWMFQMTDLGVPRFIWTPDGTVGSQIIAMADIPVGAPDLERVVLRGRLFPTSGTGWLAEFHVLDRVDGVVILDLGPHVSATGAGSIFDGTAPLEIGARSQGTAEILGGQVHAVQVINLTTGLIIAEPPIATQPGGTTSFPDAFGTYTVHGLAAIIEVPEPPPPPPPPPPDLTPLIEIELDGDVVTFDDETLINTSLDLGWPEVTTSVYGRGHVDGVRDNTHRFGARPVTLGVAAVDSEDGTATFRHALARLAPFLHPRHRPKLHLRLDGVDYRMTLVPGQQSAPFENPHHARVQLAFRAPDPYLYGDAKTVRSSGYEAATVGRAVYPWTPPRTYPPTDGSTGQVVATNAGDAYAWPLVRVMGPHPATTWTLANETTGETFALKALAIEAGHWVEVDMRERTVRYDGDPNSPRFSSIDFDLSEWLRLDPGDNVLRFATGATSDAVAVIEWADPYLWPGGLEP